MEKATRRLLVLHTLTLLKQQICHKFNEELATQYNHDDDNDNDDNDAILYEEEEEDDDKLMTFQAAQR